MSWMLHNLLSPLLVVAIVCVGGCTARGRIGSFPPDSGDGDDADIADEPDADTPIEDDASDSNDDVDLDMDDEPDTPVEPCVWRPLGSPAGTDDIRDIEFIDGERGWMVVVRQWSSEPSLYFTENAGASWTPRPAIDDGNLHHNLHGVTHVDDGAFVWTWDDGMGSSTTLWMSDDGGESFTQGPGLEGVHRAFHFYDSERGVSVDYATYSLCLTEDGGESWDCRTGEWQSFGDSRQIAALDSETWIVGGHASTDTNIGADILYSSDFGQSWEQSSLTSSASDGRSGYLSGIHVSTSTDIWVAGRYRQIFHTTDGWDTYTQVEDLPEEVIHLMDISFRGAHGIAIASLPGLMGGMGILESLDGGESWHITFSGSNFEFRQTGYKLENPVNGYLMAYGQDGLILRCEVE